MRNPVFNFQAFLSKTNFITENQKNSKSSDIHKYLKINRNILKFIKFLANANIKKH